jgi:hypothetical protein
MDLLDLLVVNCGGAFLLLMAGYALQGNPTNQRSVM